MGRSLLQAALEALLGNDRVYFQPPENIVLQYPCIVYALDRADTDYADNFPYHRSKRYAVTVIDRNPDSLIPDKVGGLQTSLLNRAYTSGNLHHTTYLLYA